MTNETKNKLYVALIIVFAVLFIAAFIFNVYCIVETVKTQKQIDQRNQTELEEALKQRTEKEEYIIACVKAELDTDSEVKLTFFKYEGYSNGYINHYIAEVDNRCYVVSATYVDNIVNVDVISEV